ncbi:ComEC/Rec2 family competence protein [Sediminispirochaeta smaragdinae]|uniref:ComEC/Rec2-related protein n=1 Tax=Sediminispirochaeta smaragdinae (strain DSM 11293 / JCM 15392 / SEBR 4228) TaxID=573413 RepID=E1R599_SEDSS|nr:ComEC/Rec2 family competence protein [Sediminispirochaeta smaragdinae]ADK80634.1 ComEC/Rec2-related protein [Sediminispirochaeta smaragdinae DSM 11293]
MPSWGIDPTRLRSVEGHLYRDPVLTASDGAILQFYVDSVRGRDGTIATGRGICTLFVPDCRDMARQALTGCEISLDLSFDEDGRPLARSSTLRLTRHCGLGRRIRYAFFRSASELFSGSPKASLLLDALLLGRKRDPSSPVFTLFRRAGASHILALSGMHIGILASLVLSLLRPIVGKRCAKVLLLFFLPFYLFLVGLRPSLVRALLFFILAGTIFWSKSASLRALTLTFLIQIVIFPLSPAELSFQLSYLALFGILTLAAPIDDILKDLLIPSALSSPLAASIAAILASAPLLFFYFGELRPASLAASVLLSLPVLLLIWSGLVQLFLHITKLSSLLACCSMLSNHVAALVLSLAQLCASLPAVFPQDPNTAAIFATLLLTITLSLRYLFNNGGIPLRLRFARVSCRFSGSAGIEHAETLRTEFPRFAGGSVKNRKAS